MKRRFTLAVSVLVLLAIFLLGLGLVITRADADNSQVKSGIVERYLDSEAGVACWIFDGDRAGGISCLPLSQTKLDQ